MIKILQLFFERQPIKQIIFSQKIQCNSDIQFSDVVDDNNSCNNEISFLENSSNNNDIIVFKISQDEINSCNNSYDNNNNSYNNNNNNNNSDSIDNNNYNSDNNSIIESLSLKSSVNESNNDEITQEYSLNSEEKDLFEDQTGKEQENLSLKEENEKELLEEEKVICKDLTISIISTESTTITESIELSNESNINKDSEINTIIKEKELRPFELEIECESPLSKSTILNKCDKNLNKNHIILESEQSISTTNVTQAIEIFEESNLEIINPIKISSSDIVLDSPIQCSPLINSSKSISILTPLPTTSISDSSIANSLPLPSVTLTVPLGSPSTEIKSLSSSTTSITAAFNEFSRQLVESASPAILGSPIYYGPTSSTTSSFTSLPSFILPESSNNDQLKNDNNTSTNSSLLLSPSTSAITKINNVPLLSLPININSNNNSPLTSPKKQQPQQHIATPRPTLNNSNNYSFINPPPPPPPSFKKNNNRQQQNSSNNDNNNLPLPSKNMKQLYWNKMNNLKGTLFDKLQQQDNNIKLDFKDIEKVFSAKSKEKKDSNNYTSNGNNGYCFSPRKSSLIQIIDVKVSQNLSIFLSSQFKGVSFSDICYNIQYGNEMMFQLNHIDSLISFLPSIDDINQINQFIKETNLLDINKLGIAEQFLLAIHNNVPQVKSRLEIMKFKYTFESKKKDLYSNINTIKQASKEIKSNEKISQIFQVILVLGNFMNGGTSRGNAYGFKLNTITKLADIKSTDNKISLLNYLSRVIIKDFPQLHCFSKDLCHVSSASRLQNLSDLIVEVSNLEKDYIKVKQLINSLDEQSHSSNQCFKQKYDAFCTHISKDIDLILNLSISTEREFKEILIIFGEDSKTESASFFNIFHLFIEQYDKATKENDQSLLLQHKKRNYSSKDNKLKIGTGSS